MKPTYLILASFIGVLALPMAAVAQDEEAIDDIVVTGQKSKGALRRDLIDAQDDFYSLYNKLNDDNEYDVRCSYEMPTGQRTKHYICRPVFFSKARNRENLNRRVSPDNDPVIKEKLVKLQEKMEILVADNPELQMAMARYNTALARFAEANGETLNN